MTDEDRCRRWAQTAASKAAFAFLCVYTHRRESVGLWGLLPRDLVTSIARRHIYESALDVLWSLLWQIQEQERLVVKDITELSDMDDVIHTSESELALLRSQRAAMSAEHQTSIVARQEKTAKLAFQMESMRPVLYTENNKRERDPAEGDDKEDDRYEVDAIRGYHVDSKRYCVAWVGFNEPTWEPAAIIERDAPECVSSFWGL
jgi:hypothetical protein